MASLASVIESDQIWTARNFVTYSICSNEETVLCINPLFRQNLCRGNFNDELVPPSDTHALN